MIVLKILAVVLGLAFLLFGYFIYFKKKYNLINGFEADFKAGRKKEEYAKRVGMVEFVVGIALLIAGVALILFAWQIGIEILSIPRDLITIIFCYQISLKPLKTLSLSHVSFPLAFPLYYIFPYEFTNSDKGKYKGKKII